MLALVQSLRHILRQRSTQPNKDEVFLESVQPTLGETFQVQDVANPHSGHWR